MKSLLSRQLPRLQHGLITAKASTPYIADPTLQLSPTQRNQILTTAKSLQSHHKVDLALNIELGEPNTTPKEIREQAIQLFNTLECGLDEDTNSGVLVNFNLANHAVDIVTGDGLGTKFTDSLVHHAIQSRVLPAVKLHGVGFGAVECAQVCLDILDERVGGGSSKKQKPSSFSGMGMLLGFVGLCGLAYTMYRDYAQRKQRQTCKYCKQHDIQPLPLEKYVKELSPAEQLEQSLGSVVYEKYKCPQCLQDSQLYKLPQANTAHLLCTKCQARTLQLENRANEGNEQYAWFHCANCKHREMKEIPHDMLRMRQSSSESSSSESDNNNNSKTGGGGFSSGGGASGKWW